MRPHTREPPQRANAWHHDRRDEDGAHFGYRSWVASMRMGRLR